MTAWLEQAACVGHDPEMFFPEPWEWPTAAIRICGRCAVTGECLRYAVDSGTRDGVWGGRNLGRRTKEIRAIREPNDAPKDVPPASVRRRAAEQGHHSTEGARNDADAGAERRCHRADVRLHRTAP